MSSISTDIRYAIQREKTIKRLAARLEGAASYHGANPKWDDLYDALI